jgi:hypothetical protein
MEEKKKCTKCLNEKILSEFHKNKQSKDGFTTRCKSCVQIKSKEWYNNNIEKNRINCKLFRENNPNYDKIKSKKWYNDNLEKAKNYNKMYSETNKKKKKDDAIKWYINNSTEIKIRINNYRKNNKEKIKLINKKYRLKNKFLFTWRRILKDSLKRMGKKKEGLTIELLGYSASELKNHLESLFTDGMSWDNYGEWHIDHIIGIVNFDKDTHASIVNALSNLRPLWATTREVNGIIYEGNLNRLKYHH